MEIPDDHQIVFDENIRAEVLDMLRESKPDSHLARCPDAVVVAGDQNAVGHAQDGPETLAQLRITVMCGHGESFHTVARYLTVLPEEETDRG